MRRILILICTILVVVFMLSCVTKDTKEDDTKKLLGSSGSEKVGEVDKVIEYVKKTGGLEEIAVDSEEAVKTYSFVKDELTLSHPSLELLSMQKAFSQVVAGHNIILICEYKTGGEERNKLLVVKVHYDTDNNRDLVSLDLDYEKSEDNDSEK